LPIIRIIYFLSEAALAKQGKTGFVHIIGYISIVLVIIWTVLQIWSFVNNKTTPLEVTIQYKGNNYPIEFINKLKNFEDTLFKDDGIFQQISECNQCDCQIKIPDYINKVKEKFGQKLSTQLTNYGGFYTLLIHNKSNLRYENTQVYIPATTLIKIYHNNLVIDSIENQNTVKIPEILPDDHILVIAWVSPSYRFIAEEITVTSNSGKAKIKMLKSDIGSIGKFADKIFPDLTSFVVDVAGFTLVVILITGLIIEFRKRIDSQKNTQ
jgi:hypothetical protein